MRLRQPPAILVLALLVVGLGAWWAHRSFEDQLRSGRAQTLVRLLATSHAPRMLETPGVEAWMLGLLQDAGTRLPPSERAAYDHLLRPALAPHLPPSMAAVSERLHPDQPLGAPVPVALVDVPSRATEDPIAVEPLRLVKHLELGDETLVLTRRRSLFEAEPTVSDGLQRAAAHLVAIAQRWRDDPPEAVALPSPPPTVPRLIRLYAIMEDGSFLSLPFPASGALDDPQARSAALAEETLQSRRRPRAPSLVS
ncbi:MAG: hypothetical protein KDK70_35765, partial [Myxococcales bacterium]|nr:hypothetical protein [Myxococcales bacterium]